MGFRVGSVSRGNSCSDVAELTGVVENRELFQQSLERDGLVLMNTQFPKQEQLLLSYKEDKAHPGGPPYTRAKYDTLDYVLTQQRWRNACKNV